MDKSSFKILIAEDDEIVQDVIVNFLEDEGYRVVLANDGMEALKILRRDDIRLVLSDLRMPGADGMEVLRTAMQINPRIAVVILTAYGTLDTALEAMKEGAYDYIVKPFVMQQLLLVVRNAFTMASLLHENDLLSDQLRETYKELETARKSDGAGNPGADSREDPVTAISVLQGRGVINEKEAGLLREKLAAHERGKDIRKYSALVNTLKVKT